ncbi:hypothetical protein COBT_001525 [Conglomerata obtusa]
MKQTINDLDKDTFIEYKKKVFKHYKPILYKHLTFSERRKIQNHGYFTICYLFAKTKFMRNNSRTIKTEIKYSCEPITIPLEFDTIMTAILQKDLKTTGIFRISANYSEINVAEQKFIELLDNKNTRQDIIDYLISLDIILLCNLFTRIFNMFSTTLFPKSLINISLILYDIDSEEERAVLMRIVMLSFHHVNRMLFESIGKFAKDLSTENCREDLHLTKSMTLNAVCKVLAPKIFLCKNEIINPQLISKHVNLLDYFFENMLQILRVDKELLR